MLSGERRVGSIRMTLAAGVVDVPVTADVMELGRPNVGLVPARRRRSPNLHRILLRRCQRCRAIDINAVVLRLDVVIIPAATNYPRIRAVIDRILEDTAAGWRCGGTDV